MGDFVTGLLDMLSGKTARASQKAAMQDRDLQRVTQDRQLSALQSEERQTSGRRRAPRGRRLLIASESGEAGVTRGTATTLG